MRCDRRSPSEHPGADIQWDAGAMQCPGGRISLTPPHSGAIAAAATTGGPTMPAPAPATHDVNRLEPGILLDGDMHRDD